MSLERRFGAHTGIDCHGDAVCELETLVLAEVVQRADQLARHPLDAQLVVELEIEGHRPRAVLGDGELVVLAGANLDVVGAQPLTGDLDRALLLELTTERGAVGCRDNAECPLVKSRAGIRRCPP